MSEETAVQPPGQRRSALGCVLRVLAAVAAIVAVAMAVTIVGGMLDSSNNREPEQTLNAGTAEEYARSDVTYFDLDHVYVVRFADGSFTALYDRSSKQQELDGSCRVAYDEFREPQGAEQLEGFRGSFVELCDGLTTVWRVDGLLVSGAGYGNLDRFQTSLSESGELLVDLSERTCTRSRGVVGIPPFDETTCGPPE